MPQNGPLSASGPDVDIGRLDNARVYRALLNQATERPILSREQGIHDVQAIRSD